MADWSKLQYDMSVLIAKRLNFIEDYLNFSTVCKYWHSAANKDNSSNLPTIPWLMLAEEEDKKEESSEGSPYRQFFSLYNGMILKKRIPEARGKRCMESMGWLITVAKDNGEINLLHPFSGVQIKLPHQNTTENYDTHHQTGHLWTFFHKAVLSTSPSQTSDYVLMVIEGDIKFLSFWRPGELRWTRIRKQSSHAAHRDVTYFNGKFYAVDWTGHVVVCDIDGPDPTQTQIIARLQYTGDQLYIVESLGSLLVVVRDGVKLRHPTDDSDRIPLTRIEADDDQDILYDDEYYDDDDDEDDDEEDVDEELTYGTTNFRVFELDLVTCKLTQNKELGDRALFIGHSASRSVQASQVHGIKPNHIYFTDDCWESYLCYEEGGGLDMGVFNLSDGTIVPHYKGVSFSRVGPPTWVTPTIC